MINNKKNSYSSGIVNVLKETSQIDDEAYDLRLNNPDTAIILYNNAIEKLKPYISTDTIAHTVAMIYVKMAGMLNAQGKYDESSKLLHKASALRKGKNDNSVSANVLTSLGQIEYMKGNFQQADTLFQQALPFAQKAIDNMVKIRIYATRGAMFTMQGDFSKADKFFKQMLNTAIDINDTSSIATAYSNLGYVSQHFNKYEDAKKYYDKAIPYCFNNKNGLANLYLNLAALSYDIGNYTEVIEYANKSLQCAEAIDSKVLIAKNYQNLADTYRTIGDNQSAINASMKAIRIKEAIDDKPSMAIGYRKIGTLYFEQKNYDKAYEYYNKAVKIDSTLQLLKELADDYLNLSTMYCETNNDSLLIKYANLALSNASKISNTLQISEINSLFGNFYTKKGNYSLALNYYQKALNHERSTNNHQQGLAKLYNEFAQLHLLMHNYGQAKKYANLSYSIADSMKIPYMIKDASTTLASAYKKTNDYKSAYNYLLISKQYNDSLFDAAKADALTFAEARWNNEKKQQEITNLQKLNKATIAKNEAERKSNRIVIISITLVGLLILITLFVLWINNKNKEKIKQQEQLNRMSLIRLQNIRNRISPHFMFNALNQQIIKDEDKEQTNTILQLTSLLRKSLEMTDNIAIPLTDEIEFVKNYLQIEGKRMGNDFITAWDIDNSISGDDWKIPAMFIQIPVENALKHALKMKAGEKRLKIKINKADIHLIIEITDNGEGYVPGRKSIYSSTGTGLNVIFQTIDILNKKNKMPILIDITNLKEKGLEGTSVKIQIPQEYEY